MVRTRWPMALRALEGLKLSPLSIWFQTTIMASRYILRALSDLALVFLANPCGPLHMPITVHSFSLLIARKIGPHAGI
ncbi:hypothetical protein SUGI_1017070 [Cryptomeria japonica]|nr:hypothetical protein SUGI_1017070 [Cryptomeria japonica]